MRHGEEDWVNCDWGWEVGGWAGRGHWPSTGNAYEFILRNVDFWRADKTFSATIQEMRWKYGLARKRNMESSA